MLCDIPGNAIDHRNIMRITYSIPAERVRGDLHARANSRAIVVGYS